MKITVIGAGKMGLPLACAFASKGADVTACDVNAGLVDAINKGHTPFAEPGLSELLPEMVSCGRLRATTQSGSAIASCDVCVVLVPVLLTPENHADLRTIEDIAIEIGKSLPAGSMVCVETTLPIGTTRRLAGMMEQRGLRAGKDFDVVFSPERVKSRLVFQHLFTIPKIVGGITPQSAERGESFYRSWLGSPVINVGTLEAAELSKLAGMIYRDVNIALANELASFAAAHGVTFEPVRLAANTDGEAAILVPGIGVGGHCTPVYPYFFLDAARTVGIHTPIAAEARRANVEQPARVLRSLGEINGRRVAILGLSFRPEVKEAAYSPAFALRTELERRGAIVSLVDPLYTNDEIRGYGFEPGRIEGSDILILNTAHEAFKNVDLVALAGSGIDTIVDGRNAWPPDAVRRAGMRYIGVGRPAESEMAAAERAT